MTIDALLKKIRKGGKDTPAVYDELIERGEEVVPVAVKALRKGNEKPFWAAVLGTLPLADRAKTLGPLLADPEDDVQLAVIRALASSGDPAVAGLLTDAFSESANVVTMQALGDHGAPSLAGPITEWLEANAAAAMADEDTSDLKLVLRAVGSLAKLGDSSRVGLAIELATFRADDPSDGGDVRLEAVQALDVSTAPGVRTALQRACLDGDGEVARAAIYALLHLGTPDAATRWLAAVEGGARGAADAARDCFLQLTGVAPPEKDLAAWWTRQSKTLTPGVCAWRGKPSTPRLMIDALRSEDAGWLRAELRQRTGISWLVSGIDQASPRELAALEAWWQEHGATFTPGKLHRWGRCTAPDAVD